MNQPNTSKTVCRRCHASLDAADNYCRHCGAPTAILAALAEQSGAARPAQQPKWWESPVVILLLLFFVLGPLALPMLWRSRGFTRNWKIALTVAVAAITVYVVWQIWQIYNQLLAPLQELHKMHGF